MAFSKNSDLERVIDAARSPEWSLGLDQGQLIMATRDSGVIGMPWVVTARKGGRGMRVELYRPGDDVTIEGEVIGEITGAARDMGRQLRGLLEDLELS